MLNWAAERSPGTAPDATGPRAPRVPTDVAARGTFGCREQQRPAQQVLHDARLQRPQRQLAQARRLCAPRDHPRRCRRRRRLPTARARPRPRIQHAGGGRRRLGPFGLVDSTQALGGARPGSGRPGKRRPCREKGHAVPEWEPRRRRPAPCPAPPRPRPRAERLRLRPLPSPPGPGLRTHCPRGAPRPQPCFLHSRLTPSARRHGGLLTWGATNGQRRRGAAAPGGRMAGSKLGVGGRGARSTALRPAVVAAQLLRRARGAAAVAR